MALKLAWSFWLIGIVATFAGLEYYGYVQHGVPGTFSDYMRGMGRLWTPWYVVWGFIGGALVAHFWWASS